MIKIYTKTGDKGQTGLWGGARVPKNHPRVGAYGDVDELNSAIGLVISTLPKTKVFQELKKSLNRIQEELFVLGALLATPPGDESRLPAPFNQGIPPAGVTDLEKAIDRMTHDLEPLKKFILPGGSAPGSQLHLARTVCRRAEREVVALLEREPVADNSIIYLNRLSDYLFTAARWANHKLKTRETPWEGLR